MESLIKIANVYKIYNKGENQVNALDGINIEIFSGEFVAIIGSSGSGKSTLMNILGCLDEPTTGEYYLAGELISNCSDDKLSYIRNKKIGFIFQGFNLIPSLTAIENVELPLIYRGMKKLQRRQLSLSSIDKVGLSSRINHRPSQMSGGQQQRVAIARAIAASPPIILADEPTGNLDSKSGQDVMDILINIKNQGKTIILITHDNEIAKKADRIIRIQDGKITSDIDVSTF